MGQDAAALETSNTQVTQQADKDVITIFVNHLLIANTNSNRDTVIFNLYS